ncbi:MAG TPA: hypothetical protein VFJ64_11890 [Solirubrobacterales bacterium]|nr:hypothetical protein [Solirubrobacterales bacterium]
MKPLKMFVLAALAALMAMAFAGASSAMAESTELCDLDPGTAASAPCPNGTEAVVHVHETSVGKAILLASPKIECNVLFLGAVKAGNPLVIEGNFTYSSCGSGCTVTEEGGPSSIAVLREGHETAKVTGEGEVHVNCIGINCFYNGEELVGTAKGPLLASKTIDIVEGKEINLTENGEVSIQNQEVKKTKGTFCPATGKLDIKTTPLEPTYIGKPGGLHYCVKYEHAGHGWYKDSNCSELLPSRSGNYGLVIAEAGLKVEQPLCVHLFERKGLWKEIVSATECKSDDTENKSLYEQGTIATVG